MDKSAETKKVDICQNRINEKKFQPVPEKAQIDQKEVKIHPENRFNQFLADL